MTLFDERPIPSPSRQKLRLLGLPLLAALVCGGLWLHHPAHWQQGLEKFRGEEAAQPGPNLSMDSSLAVRRFLLMHPGARLTSSQGAALIASAQGPTDDQAQSEALDVLSLATRANALSPGQALSARQVTLQVLARSPGPMVRLESARLLGHLGDQASAPALRILQQDTDPKIQSAAASALVRLQQ